MDAVLLPILLGHSAIRIPSDTKLVRMPDRLSSLGDANDGGLYKVTGTLKIDAQPDIPVSRKIRLVCVRSARMVRETWSDAATGEYSFLFIRQGPWLVIAHDYTKSYNAVVADNISAVPM